MLEEQGELGAGPGQFQAAYPPYRSLEEIELSSFSRSAPTPIEVEHAHNDGLTALVEYGWLGGGAFVLFLIATLVAGLRAMGSDHTIRRDFGPVAVAMVVGSLVNSPLLYGVAAPIAAFTAFGVVSSTGLVPVDRRRTMDLAPPLLALVALVLLTPKAISYLRYGRAMAQVPDALVVRADGVRQLDGQRLMGILDAALELRPDAPEALEKRAEVLRRAAAPLEELRAAHGALLAVRPMGLAARLAAGTVESKAGAFGRAAEHFEAAFALDAGSPRVLRNRVRLAFDRHDLDGFVAAVDDLGALAPIDQDLLDKYLREALLTGRPKFAQPVSDRMRRRSGEQPIDTTDIDTLSHAATLARTAGQDALYQAYMAGYKMLLARDQLEAPDNADIATVSARLAYQKARDQGADTGPARLRYAACLAAKGDIDGARAALDEGPIRPADVGALEEVFRAALRAASLLPGASLSAGD